MESVPAKGSHSGVEEKSIGGKSHWNRVPSCTLLHLGEREGVRMRWRDKKARGEGQMETIQGFEGKNEGVRRKGQIKPARNIMKYYPLFCRYKQPAYGTG